MKKSFWRKETRWCRRAGLQARHDVELSVLEKNLTALIPRSSLKMEMMIQGRIYEGRGAGGMYLFPALSPWDVLQLHGDTKSAVSFAMYSQKFTPCHCPVITLLLQQSIKTYFLVVHPLLQNILNLPPIMTMIMIMTTTMMIKYCAVGICRGSHESLLVWDFKYKGNFSACTCTSVLFLRSNPHDPYISASDWSQ